MERLPARELPDSLNRIEFRTVGWQELERELSGVLFSPVFVQLGMVIPRVVYDKGDTPARS